jgi:hypothetical protein
MLASQNYGSDCNINVTKVNTLSDEILKLPLTFGYMTVLWLGVLTKQYIFNLVFETIIYEKIKHKFLF